MSKNIDAAKTEIKMAKDRLLGELIGLSKAICGSIDEERFVPDADCHRVMLESLIMVAAETIPARKGAGSGENRDEEQKLRKLMRLSKLVIAEKWKRVPACEHCKHPCGRVAAYDLSELSEDEPAVRSLKGEILANVKKAAEPAWSALQNGMAADELCQGFSEALYAVGIFFNKEKLKPARQKSDLLLRDSLKLEAQGRQKALDERFMKEALRQAKKAAGLGEVPIGCVIVREGQIISRGYNRRTTDHNVLAHAEIMAMDRACKKIRDWRLSDCTLYVTLEPCPMCAGAMVQSRLGRCVIGSMSDKSGCAGSIINLLQEKGFNHQVEITAGVLGNECSGILSDFFEQMRKGSVGV